jgi:ABC-2 type transport system permease protein
MRAVLAIAKKDLRLMFRDKGDVFFTFALPALMAVLFGFVFGGGGGGSKIKLALVNESDAGVAARIADDLANDQSFKVERMENRDAAVAAVRSGKATAAVMLPASMQQGVDSMLSGGGIPIDVVVDPSRRAEAGLIQGKLNELAFRQFPRIMADQAQMKRMFDGMRRSIESSKELSPGQKLAGGALATAGEAFSRTISQSVGATEGPNAATGAETGAANAATPSFSPVRVAFEELPKREGGPRSSFDVSTPIGIVWGIAGCVGAFAASLVVERTRGTLARLRLAPITRAHLLAGKGLACFFTAMVVQALLVLLAVVGFSSSIMQPAMLAVACVFAAFAFTGLAMLIAGLCKTEAEANGAGRGAILVLALIGGGTIPLFFMPPVLETLSYASPFRWAVMAIEGPFWRDLPVSEQLVPLLVLLSLGLGGFLLGARLGALREAR